MKKIIYVLISLSIILPIFFICANQASAAVALQNPITGQADGSAGGGASLENVVTLVIRYVLGVTGVAALIAFVYGGVWWLISMGDSNKVAKGKNIMVWALMGLIVIFASYAIVNMILEAVGK